MQPPPSPTGGVLGAVLVLLNLRVIWLELRSIDLLPDCDAGPGPHGSHPVVPLRMQQIQPSLQCQEAQVTPGHYSPFSPGKCVILGVSPASLGGNLL